MWGRLGVCGSAAVPPFVVSGWLWSCRVWNAAIGEMLPRVIAYNRNNYARHMSVYWCEMVLLPQTHPYSNALLVDGQFAVQRSAFAQVPVDHTIEQTMNRYSKTNGGIVGISLNRGAVQSWNITAHD